MFIHSLIALWGQSSSSHQKLLICHKKLFTPTSCIVFLNGTSVYYILLPLFISIYLCAFSCMFILRGDRVTRMFFFGGGGGEGEGGLRKYGEYGEGKRKEKRKGKKKKKTKK